MTGCCSSSLGTRRWQKALWQWDWPNTAGATCGRGWRGSNVQCSSGVISSFSCPFCPCFKALFALPPPSPQPYWCQGKRWVPVRVLSAPADGLVCGREDTGHNSHAWLSATGSPKSSQGALGWEIHRLSNLKKSCEQMRHSWKLALKVLEEGS